MRPWRRSSRTNARHRGPCRTGLSYAELADAMGRPSADAARMAVGRALLKLAKLLKLP